MVTVFELYEHYYFMYFQGESEVERMNAANRKHGTNVDSNQDNIVQLVQVTYNILQYTSLLVAVLAVQLVGLRLPSL